MNTTQNIPDWLGVAASALLVLIAIFIGTESQVVFWLTVVVSLALGVAMFFAMLAIEPGAAIVGGQYLDRLAPGWRQLGPALGLHDPEIGVDGQPARQVQRLPQPRALAGRDRRFCVVLGFVI